jgi:deoxyxylulose-5-phosphate synthase
VTVEDHALAGGFGSALLELFADRAPGTRVVRLACPTDSSTTPSRMRSGARPGSTRRDRARRCRALDESPRPLRRPEAAA